MIKSNQKNTKHNEAVLSNPSRRCRWSSDRESGTKETPGLISSALFIPFH